MARAQGQPAGEAACLRALGTIAAAGDPPDAAAAESCFAQAGELAATLEMRPLVAHCHFELAKLRRRAGHLDQAREDLAVATTMYRGMDMPFFVAAAEAESRMR